MGCAGSGRAVCTCPAQSVCGPHAAQALVRGLGMATLQSPISPWALLSFSEEMPYLKCPLHAVLKLTPMSLMVAWGPSPTETGPPGWASGAVTQSPFSRSRPVPPSPRCRVESIYLSVESVSTHRERSEVSVSCGPLLTPAVSSVWEGPWAPAPGTPCGGGAGKICVSRWHPPASVWTCGPRAALPDPSPLSRLRDVPPACLSGGFLASSSFSFLSVLLSPISS